MPECLVTGQWSYPECFSTRNPNLALKKSGLWIIPGKTDNNILFSCFLALLPSKLSSKFTTPIYVVGFLMPHMIVIKLNSEIAIIPG